jgi:N-acetyl-gamma-glutamyl-phosphate reductase
MSHAPRPPGAAPYRVGVVGASGYTGAELLRLAAGHPHLEVAHVTANANAGAAVGELFPSLRAAYPELRFSSYAAADLDGLDVVFCALPHGESQRVIPELVDAVAHVVDLGADFRLPPGVYAQWYGQEHEMPGLVGKFAYGLPELFRDDVQTHAHVAAPGCYPTAVNLALAPLLSAGLIEPTGIVANAVSGVSGRGRGLSAPSLFSEANESVAAYGLLSHRHTAEMEMVLSRVAGRPVTVLFTPHLVPITRGILATCSARPEADGLSTAALLDRFRDFYRDEPFVVVVDEPSPTKATTGSNAVHVTARFDARTGTVLAIAVEDNLVKGASGQAVQCANILLELPETAGLTVTGLMP